MEYQVWEWIEEEQREFLRWSGNNPEEAREWANFYGENCVVRSYAPEVKNDTENE